jgi:hypothetical protein
MSEEQKKKNQACNKRRILKQTEEEKLKTKMYMQEYHKKYIQDDEKHKKLNEYFREYHKKNKVRRNELGKIYSEKNKDEIAKRQKNYEQKNRGKISSRKKKYYENNPDKLKERHDKSSQRRDKEKKRLFDILGERCIICGEENRKFLTFDHINDDGNVERKIHSGLFTNIKNIEWDEGIIKSRYQVLCYNHNMSKNRRIYLDLPFEDLTKYQKEALGLWQKSLEFFGPCYCGEDDIHFLSIDHKNGDGAEKRRNGERSGVALLRQFRKFGWPESLKDTYRILCFNHNCGHTK